MFQFLQLLLVSAFPVLPSAACIPMNNMLSGPLAGPFDLIIGAIGGVITTIAAGIAVILAVIALINVLTSKSVVWLKAIGLTLLIPVLLFLGLLIYHALVTSVLASAIC